MYKTLNKKEIKKFTKKYFEIWEGDIFKISLIQFDNIEEYLINDYYLYYK